MCAILLAELLEGVFLVNPVIVLCLRISDARDVQTQLSALVLLKPIAVADESSERNPAGARSTN